MSTHPLHFIAVLRQNRLGIRAEGVNAILDRFLVIIRSFHSTLRRPVHNPLHHRVLKGRKSNLFLVTSYNLCLSLTSSHSK